MNRFGILVGTDKKFHIKKSGDISPVNFVKIRKYSERFEICRTMWHFQANLGATGILAEETWANSFSKTKIFSRVMKSLGMLYEFEEGKKHP